MASAEHRIRILELVFARLSLDGLDGVLHCADELEEWMDRVPPGTPADTPDKGRLTPGKTGPRS